ncbi:MAG: tyrosine-type recombinase/integrase [Actinobacteria bacterium]|nr:tyrosine-type recombinase/integrase [Actinomycetota bacterium]
MGTPLHYRNLSRRGLGGALERAGLGAERVRFHDLRHTFASILIGQGENVVYASRQLGHASPDITLSVYAHLFDRAEHAARASDRLEAAFGNLVETSGGERRRTAGGGEIVDLASGAGSGV